MGVLDDAIREHLDLKRRRGADPAEVERAEREALGPVRRAPVESTDGELELHPPVELEDEYAVEEHEEWEEPYEDGAAAHEPLAPELYAPGPPAPEPYAPESPEPEPLPPEPPVAAPEPLAAAPSEPLAPEPPAPPPAEPDDFEDVEPTHSRDLFERGELAGDATVEYDVERALDAEHARGAEHEPGAEPEPGADGEDVLEETPEFLQDTPDHDRLWFEQKPPKDFDFDG
jgi:hypothetical protein